MNQLFRCNSFFFRQTSKLLCSNARSYNSIVHSRSSLFNAKQLTPFTLSASKSASSATADHGKAHDHSTLWKAERALAGGLLLAIPASFVFQSPPMDYLLALALVMHSHWGIEAITVDYIRPVLFGPVIPKIAIWVVHALSILALAGLFYFNYTDVGVAQAIKMFFNA